MKFSIAPPVRVTAIANITTKNGKPMTFVTFANTQTLEVLETALSLAKGQTEADIVEQREYTAVFETNGKWNSVTLTPLATVANSTSPNPAPTPAPAKQ